MKGEHKVVGRIHRDTQCRVDWLIETRMVKQNNYCYEYRIRSLKFRLLLKLYMRINIGSSLEFLFPARNFKKMRILKLMRFILVRWNFILQNPVKSDLIFPVEGFPVPENGLEMEILKKILIVLKFKMLWRFFEMKVDGFPAWIEMF